MIFKTTILLIALANTVNLIQSAPTEQSVEEENFKLVLLHNNDIHGRFEQIDSKSGNCKKSDADKNKCYGGIARIATVVQEYRARAARDEIPPVLYFNAGDTYMGTTWFSLYKDNITAKFLNLLRPDAMSLGNHEFDEGVENLGQLLKKLTFPVLSANLDVSKEPSLHVLEKSKVFTVKGTKIGVIGYLTPDTKIASKPNQVEYISEIEAINLETKKLKEDGVDIILALGHSGVVKDQEIAASCPDVDVVVGGHSHTFLYSSDVPSKEVAFSTYPIVVEQASGKKVPVVQAYAFSKYLGVLNLEFDPLGNLVKFDGSPILLDSSIPQDPTALKVLEIYRPGVNALAFEVIGKSKVYLDGSTCRLKECNLGNFIADGIVHWHASKTLTGSNWTDASIALVPSGGIRGSFDHRESNGTITRGDLLKVLPFNDKIAMIEMKGWEILKALEHSVYKYPDDSDGEFLQMSGMTVLYDVKQPTGHRVQEVKVLCAACQIPKYEPLIYSKAYNVLVTVFLGNGGDGYDLKNHNKTDLEEFDINIFEGFIKKNSPVLPKIEGRIMFYNSNVTFEA